MHDQTSSDWWSVVFCVFYLSSKTRSTFPTQESGTAQHTCSARRLRSECLRQRSYCNRASAHSRRSVSAIFLLGNCNYVHGAGPNSASRFQSSEKVCNDLIRLLSTSTDKFAGQQGSSASLGFVRAGFIFVKSPCRRGFSTKRWKGPTTELPYDEQVQTNAVDERFEESCRYIDEISYSKP